MRDKTFAQAMSQIAREAEAHQQAELRAEQRRQTFAKIRRVCVFLFGVAALGGGFYFRGDLQQAATKLTDKLTTEPKVNGATAAALSDIKNGAAKRDRVLDEIGK